MGFYLRIRERRFNHYDPWAIFIPIISFKDRKLKSFNINFQKMNIFRRELSTNVSQCPYCNIVPLPLIPLSLMRICNLFIESCPAADLTLPNFQFTCTFIQRAVQINILRPISDELIKMSKNGFNIYAAPSLVVK
ncbi:hypothetical protein D3C73_646460 [compost metagenome]